ncbi:MAG: FKBP-type peptidyl-prolyl cis-trans isomerase [Myxococcota bacterium]
MTRAWLACLLLLAAIPAAGAEDARPPAATRAAGGGVVKPGDWVWIDFAVWEQSGALLDTTTHTQPLRVKHGVGTLPKEVEQAMVGMAIDEHKTVHVAMAAASDASAGDRYQSVALEDLPETTRRVGHPIVMEDGSGRRRAGRIHEIEGDRAVIDWNPMAGQTVTFDFRIVDIYVPEAEAEEPAGD